MRAQSTPPRDEIAASAKWRGGCTRRRAPETPLLPFPKRPRRSRGLRERGDNSRGDSRSLPYALFETPRSEVLWLPGIDPAEKGWRREASRTRYAGNRRVAPCGQSPPPSGGRARSRSSLRQADPAVFRLLPSIESDG